MFNNIHRSKITSHFFLYSQIMGNDVLFFGDSSYVRELLSLTESVLQNLVDIIEQEPSRVNLFQKLYWYLIDRSFFFFTLSMTDLSCWLKAARGSLSLEACNCIASSFKVGSSYLFQVTNLNFLILA